MTFLRTQEYKNHKTKRLESHKVKVTLEQATKTQWGSRSIALLFL